MSEPPRPPMGYGPYGDDSRRWQQPQPTAPWQGQSPGQWSQGPPSGQWQPPAPARKRGKLALFVVGAMLIAAAATGGGLYLTGAFSTEIRVEPVAYDDTEAFTGPVGDGVELAGVSAPAAPAVPAGAPDQPVLSGNKPGLYGGTGDDKSCNKDQLIAFLQQDPAKAAAWAGVQGIQASEIPAFVTSLTPILLRTDTAVTNHGFRNGVANPINSVLQAGTAVLVDDRGMPRARCKCGNPLLEGKQFTRTRTTGTVWPGYDQKKVAKIQGSPTPIQSFDVVNVYTGQTYQQTVDSSVNAGGSATPGTTAPSGTRTGSSKTSSARTTTAQRPAGQQQQQQQAGGAQQQQQAPATSAAPAGGNKKCKYPGGEVEEGGSFDVGSSHYVMGPGCTPQQQ